MVWESEIEVFRTNFRRKLIIVSFICVVIDYPFYDVTKGMLTFFGQGLIVLALFHPLLWGSTSAVRSYVCFLGMPAYMLPVLGILLGLGINDQSIYYIMAVFCIVVGTYLWLYDNHARIKFAPEQKLITMKGGLNPWRWRSLQIDELDWFIYNATQVKVQDSYFGREFTTTEDLCRLVVRDIHGTKIALDNLSWDGLHLIESVRSTLTKMVVADKVERYHNREIVRFGEIEIHLNSIQLPACGPVNWRTKNFAFFCSASFLGLMLLIVARERGFNWISFQTVKVLLICGFPLFLSIATMLWRTSRWQKKKFEFPLDQVDVSVERGQIIFEVGTGKKFIYKVKTMPNGLAIPGFFEACYMRKIEEQGESSVWHTAIDGKTQGPFTANQLRTMLETGQITSETFLWRKEFSDWQPLHSIEQLKELIDY